MKSLINCLILVLSCGFLIVACGDQKGDRTVMGKSKVGAKPKGKSLKEVPVTKVKADPNALDEKNGKTNLAKDMLRNAQIVSHGTNVYDAVLEVLNSQEQHTSQIKIKSFMRLFQTYLHIAGSPSGSLLITGKPAGSAEGVATNSNQNATSFQVKIAVSHYDSAKCNQATIWISFNEANNKWTMARRDCSSNSVTMAEWTYEQKKDISVMDVKFDIDNFAKLTKIGMMSSLQGGAPKSHCRLEMDNDKHLTSMACEDIGQQIGTATFAIRTLKYLRDPKNKEDLVKGTAEKYLDSTTPRKLEFSVPKIGQVSITETIFPEPGEEENVIPDSSAKPAAEEKQVVPPAPSETTDGKLASEHADPTQMQTQDMNEKPGAAAKPAAQAPAAKPKIDCSQMSAEECGHAHDEAMRAAEAVKASGINPDLMPEPGTQNGEPKEETGSTELSQEELVQKQYQQFQLQQQQFMQQQMYQQQLQQEQMSSELPAPQ